MPRPVELPELPGCNVCEVLELPTINPATGDSVVSIPGHRQCWGYTCEMHSGYRVGEITPLVKAEG